MDNRRKLTSDELSYIRLHKDLLTHKVIADTLKISPGYLSLIINGKHAVCIHDNDKMFCDSDFFKAYKY